MPDLYPSHAEQNKKNKLTDYFHKSLINDADAGEVRDYLNSRGIGKTLSNKFMLGFCSHDVADRVSMSGLGGSLIFPIIDEFGDTIAFSGRIPHNNKVDQPKYWHENYNKSFFLYNLNLAWPNILKKNIVVIVEGQTDAISCYKAGVENVVAVMGTALTKIHLSKLLMFCNRFIIMFDGGDPNADPRKNEDPGQVNALKAEKLIRADKNANYDCLVINLRDKERYYDPDGFIGKYGSSVFKRYVRKLWNLKITEKRVLEPKLI